MHPFTLRGSATATGRYDVADMSCQELTVHDDIKITKLPRRLNAGVNMSNGAADCSTCTTVVQGSRIRSVRILFSERYVRTLTYSILAYVNKNRIRA